MLEEVAEHFHLVSETEVKCRDREREVKRYIVTLLAESVNKESHAAM